MKNTLPPESSTRSNSHKYLMRIRIFIASFPEIPPADRKKSVAYAIDPLFIAPADKPIPPQQRWLRAGASSAPFAANKPKINRAQAARSAAVTASKGLRQKSIGATMRSVQPFSGQLGDARPRR